MFKTDINKVQVGQVVKAFHPRKFGVIDEGKVTCKRKGCIWVYFGQKTRSGKQKSFRVPLAHILED